VKWIDQHHEITKSSSKSRELDTLTPEVLDTHLEWKDKPISESVGTSLLKNIYHYWFHLGETHAIPQMPGHFDLPQFGGDMSEVRYRLEE
jgi:hypothetical protein